MSTENFKCPWDETKGWENMSAILPPQNGQGGLYLGDILSATNLDFLNTY